VFARNLTRAGFARIGDLAAADSRDLGRRFGAAGLRLARLAHGRDVRPVDPKSPRKSISAETTFDDDITAASLEDRLWPLCEKVARHARAEAITGRVVTLKLRLANFRIITRRRSLGAATQTAKTLFATARQLLAEADDGGLYRLIGVGMSDLRPAGERDDFFGAADSRALIGERAADALRSRFGDAALMSGRSLDRGAKRPTPR
jgi:DNA polymerase-4